MDQFDRNEVSLRATAVYHQARRTERFERERNVVCFRGDTIGT